ncbi:hypothetical protein Goari_022049, partial [Gossypium aridum]|nr:hypothetical protein [Gossypium aridum]
MIACEDIVTAMEDFDFRYYLEVSGYEVFLVKNSLMAFVADTGTAKILDLDSSNQTIIVDNDCSVYHCKGAALIIVLLYLGRQSTNVSPSIVGAAEF